MALTRETRAVHGFSEVVLRGYGKLIVEQTADPTAEGITIEADEEVLPRISTEVRGRRLILGFTMAWYEWFGYWFTWLLLPDKRITGSGRIRLDSRESLDVWISGAGRVQYRGNPSVSSHISGSGRIVHAA